MRRSRCASGLLLVGLLALVHGCGGGGGSSSDGKRPSPAPPPALHVTGVLGGGLDGWHLDGAVEAGDDQRSLDDARDVFVAGDGTIYVAEMGNARVSRWSADAGSLGWIGWGQDGWQTGAPPPLPQAGWSRIDADAAGDVYLATSHAILKLTPDGRSLGSSPSE